MESNGKLFSEDNKGIYIINVLASPMVGKGDSILRFHEDGMDDGLQI